MTDYGELTIHQRPIVQEKMNLVDPLMNTSVIRNNHHTKLVLTKKKKIKILKFFYL